MAQDTQDRSQDRSFRSALVLGSRGFIGQHVVQQLAGAGATVTGIDLSDFPDAAHCANALKAALQNKPELIVHAAGMVGNASSDAFRAAHAGSTETLLDVVARQDKAARVVVIGSAAELGLTGGMRRVAEREGGAPTSAYGTSKLAQSQIAREMALRLGLDVVRVRVFNTLGPGQSAALVAGALVERLDEAHRNGKKTFLVRNPTHVRDYLDVRDIARCIVRLAQRLEREPNRKPINICSGGGTSVAGLVGELLAVANMEIAPHFSQDEGPESRMVGEPATLRPIMAGEPIQEISTFRSLGDMWQARTPQPFGSQGNPPAGGEI